MVVNILEKEGSATYGLAKVTVPFTVGSRVPLEDQKPTIGKPLSRGSYTSHDPETGTEFRIVKPVSGKDRDALIRTIIGEAAHQGPKGWAAVAEVVVNRTEDTRWPNSIYDVVHQPKQFSAWNSEAAEGNDLVRDYGPDTGIYEQVGNVVDQVLAGNVTSGVGDATHYYSPSAMRVPGSKPNWWDTEVARANTTPIRVGDHIFTGENNNPSNPRVVRQGFGLPTTLAADNRIDFNTLPTGKADASLFVKGSATGDTNISLLPEPAVDPQYAPDPNSAGYPANVAEAAYNARLNRLRGVDLSGSAILSIHNTAVSKFQTFVSQVTPRGV